MDKLIHLTVYNVCNFSYMLGLKFIPVKPLGPHTAYPPKDNILKKGVAVLIREILFFLIMYYF